MQEKKIKSKNDRLNSTRQTIRFEDDLLKLIQQQAKKDNESFSGWVKTACKMRLGK
ncbi:YlcI/YnfO family protein [Gilliamella apicola]|uniref:YlcI/YnfO family protein n=1 Tax=Gilliamella apicola TaxID=1196095 RepID=UPI00398757AE